jgi:hypothetical protein
MEPENALKYMVWGYHSGGYNTKVKLSLCLTN